MKITELKQSAKTKLTGSYIKCILSSLLYFIIISLLTAAQSLMASKLNNAIILTLIQALFLIISLILGYGIVSNILDLTDSKTNAITDFLNQSIKNTTKFIKILLRIISKIWIQIILFLVSAFYLYGTIIARINKVDFLCFHQNLLLFATIVFFVMLIIFVYFLLDYMLISYILHSNKEKTAKEIAEDSKRIMKGQKFKYILLHLSFWDWFIIATIILMILNQFIPSEHLTIVVLIFYSLLKPHLTVSKSEFYEDLNSVIEENTKVNSKNKSSKAE